MKNLSFIEFMALCFTGVAGMASAIQAYVSWETRGEVSRAIVFAERIDACSKVLAAIDPFVEKARADRRAVIQQGGNGGRYSLPAYYYRQSAGTGGFNTKHAPRVSEWRVASAAFSIVNAGAGEEAYKFFDDFIVRDIEGARFMDKGQFLALLEKVDVQSDALREACRSFL